MNTVKNLKISEKFADHYLLLSLARPSTLNAILKYKDHASIRVIKRVSQRFLSFYFSPVDNNTVLKKIRKLKSNKTVQGTDIPVKNLKDNAEFCAKYIYLQYNKVMKKSLNFPNCFKFANIVAAFKQDSRNQKNICKSISTLPLISKIFEKPVCRPLLNYLENILLEFTKNLLHFQE